MIHIEYLHDDSEDCPLIRLYGYEAPDVVALRDLCVALAAGQVREVALEQSEFVCAIEGCRLLLRAGRFNRGITTPKPAEPFVMEYTEEGWLEVAEKITPFVDGSSGYQWLTEEGDIDLLISRNGLW
jgi:hypothetical protein